MSERSVKRRFFEASYDGATYSHTYRLDPRLLIGGTIITLISAPLLWLAWPAAAATWLVPALGVALIGLSFRLHHRFTASAEGFTLSWSLGPFGWTTRLAADKVEPVASRGRRTYRVLLRRGGRRFDPWIEAGGRAEAEAWVSFLRDVSRGVPARWPEEETPWPLRGA